MYFMLYFLVTQKKKALLNIQILLSLVLTPTKHGEAAVYLAQGSMKTYKDNRICPTDKKNNYIYTQFFVMHVSAQKSFNLANVKEFDFENRMENRSGDGKALYLALERSNY